MTVPGTVLIEGVCGSTAHGLATENSDTDIHGVFSVTTEKILGLGKYPESWVESKPDKSYHELKKFLQLGLKCNTQALELLWLDDHTVLEEWWGQALIGVRRNFLSTGVVRSSYCGFSAAHLRRIEKSYSNVSPEEELSLRKSAKHMIRNLEQGYKLLTTGEVHVKVDDRDMYLDILAERPFEKIISDANHMLNRLSGADSVLPDKQNAEDISEFLFIYRSYHYLESAE